jgi:hypothetical protein
MDTHRIYSTFRDWYVGTGSQLRCMEKSSPALFKTRVTSCRIASGDIAGSVGSNWVLAEAFMLSISIEQENDARSLKSGSEQVIEVLKQCFGK